MEIEDNGKVSPFIGLDTLLEILGNPTRRVMLAKLAKVPHSTSELASSLNISRQAVHSQLEILSRSDIIERIGSEKRGGKYKIKSNLSLTINISPDHYKIRYNVVKIEKNHDNFQKMVNPSTYDSKQPDEKLEFLGVKIKEIEKKTRNLELERNDLLQDKECYIKELKNIMNQQFAEDLRREQPNLEKEIFYTLFFNPERYRRKINIDNLLDDMFFSDMDMIKRDQNRVMIRHLLTDLAQYMRVIRFKEEDEDWFFDI